MHSVATDGTLGQEVSEKCAAMGSPGVFKYQDQGSKRNSPSKQSVKVCQACADESLAVESRSGAQTCMDEMLQIRLRCYPALQTAGLHIFLQGCLHGANVPAAETAVPFLTKLLFMTSSLVCLVAAAYPQRTPAHPGMPDESSQTFPVANILCVEWSG